MNTYDVKKELGTFYRIKLILSGIAIYFAFIRGNTLFQSVVSGLYVLSVLTISCLIYKKTRSFLGTFLIFIAVFTAFIILQIPGFVISIMMLFMMFLGIVYDCFQWVRLIEITYDYKHGKKEKWVELDKAERSTRHYSTEDKAASCIVDTASQKHKMGNELAVKMESYITSSEQIWSKLWNCCDDEKISVLYEEYNTVISGSREIRKYFEVVFMCSADPAIESCKYEEMRMFFNRFQRIRRKLHKLQQQYLGVENKKNNTESSALNYFKGCNSLESLQKRYRDLSKVYHPDMGNGSVEIFREIQTAYDNLKKKYE